MNSIDTYLGLVTSEHNQKPKFMAMVAATLQPSVDAQLQYSKLSSLMDLDAAVGDQLDILGEWIGVARDLDVPLTDIWFSWGISGLGWGEAAWIGPNESPSGMVRLQDDFYRLYLQAVAASNQWDGTLPGLYNIWAIVFAGADFQLIVLDNQNMTITVDILIQTIDAVSLALIEGGKIVPKPAGVGITGYTQVPAPVFGWGVNNGLIGGWGIGSWI